MLIAQFCLERPNPTSFIWLNQILDPKFGLSRVWLVHRPQIGSKLGFNPIMYLMNPNEPDLDPILGWVGPPGSKFGLSRVGLVGFIWQH